MNEGLLNVVLILAGIFFVANTLLFIVIGVAIMKIAKAIQELKPRVDELSAKLEKINGDVNRLTKSVQTVVDMVGTRALGALESAQGFAMVATKGAAKFSPILAGVLTVLKVFTTVRGMRKR